MLTKEQETDTEVRKEDQDHINEFGALNARLHENRAEKDVMTKRLEELDDASAELMMCGGGDDDEDDEFMGGGGGGGGGVSLLLGDAFIQVSENEATEYCETEVDKIQKVVDGLNTETTEITERQKELKKRLYGRFGASINLEESGPPNTGH